jgi:hypothetical protein
MKEIGTPHPQSFILSPQPSTHHPQNLNPARQDVEVTVLNGWSCILTGKISKLGMKEIASEEEHRVLYVAFAVLYWP